MSIENRQKIPVPRRSFLWSLNETSGEILTHVGPTEFTPSANDRIVRSTAAGGFEQAPMEARPFVVARDGEYVLLKNPSCQLRSGGAAEELASGLGQPRPQAEGERNPVKAEPNEAPNGAFVPGGNKEKELQLGTTRVVAGPCAFPLWPGQSAEVRPAHKLGANQYLLVEVVGDVDEKARYFKLVLASAGLSSAVIDAGDAEPSEAGEPAPRADERALRLGQRIVIQGRHTQLFVPPSGIEVVAPIEEDSGTAVRDADDDGLQRLAPATSEETGKLLAQVREGLSQKQFSTLKNELRHRSDLTIGERAVILAALDAAHEERQQSRPRGPRAERSERARGPSDPYARRAVVLGPKEFCVLFDADGKPRIVRGPARVFPGPHDTFLHRGSRRRVYDAYELGEHQALWIRVIAPIARDALARHLPGLELDQPAYDAGAEFVLRGRPTVFFPFIEAEVVHPETGEPHVGNDHASVVLEVVGIDQKSAIHVRDRRTGLVKMVRGETSYLVDPRSEEHVHRQVPAEQWNLWIAHAAPHLRSGAPVTTPWALSVTVPNGEACLVTSRHARRVEIGPKVVLLDFEEALTTLTLSRGPSKDGHATLETAFLRVEGGRVADTFDLESSDFVRLRLKLGFTGHFEASSAEGQEAWFHVADPVKLLADTVRARVRASAQRLPAATLLAGARELVQAALFTDGALRFPQNGMVLDQADVLALDIVDPALAAQFQKLHRESLDLELKDRASTRRLDSLRHQDAIDEEEHAIVRRAIERKAASNVVDAETTHGLALRKVQLDAVLDAAALAKRQAEAEAARKAQLVAERELGEAAATAKLRDAEASARAARSEHEAVESHRAALAAIEKELARAFAEADAVRLAAIQKELVGALHVAADAEVLKAAANNMNLVALLGGKSPAELLAQVVRGTPLERATNGMRARRDAEEPAKTEENGSR